MGTLGMVVEEPPKYGSGQSLYNFSVAHRSFLGSGVPQLEKEHAVEVRWPMSPP